MPADLWLPVTPSIRRIARTFLTGDDDSASSEWWAPWRGWMAPKCYKCGAFNQYRPPVCLACGDTRVPWRVHALPLHIPAGLAIARVRLAELVGLPGGAPRWRRGEPKGVPARWCLDVPTHPTADGIVLFGLAPAQREVLPFVVVPGIESERNDGAAIGLALRHLDPELREAPNADR